MPLIDLIIPAYNCGTLLNKCLESLVTQTFGHWRAFVIDDCSNDGITPQLCNTWATNDKRIQVKHFTLNKGVSAARNYALGLSSAPYIAFLDSDDWLEPMHLELLYAYITKYDADIALCSFRKVYSNRLRTKVKNKAKAGTQYIQPAIFGLGIMDRTINAYLWNKLYRRELWNGTSFPEGIYYEDFYIMPQILAKAQKAVHTGNVTYNYRQHQKGITSCLTPKKAVDICLATKERVDAIKQYEGLTSSDKLSLLTWPIKTFQYELYNVTKMLPSHEQRIALETIEQIMVAYNVPYFKPIARLQKLLLSLQRRWYTISFKRKYCK